MKIAVLVCQWQFKQGRANQICAEEPLAVVELAVIFDMAAFLFRHGRVE